MIREKRVAASSSLKPHCCSQRLMKARAWSWVEAKKPCTTTTNSVRFRSRRFAWTAADLCSISLWGSLDAANMANRLKAAVNEAISMSDGRQDCSTRVRQAMLEVANVWPMESRAVTHPKERPLREGWTHSAMRTWLTGPTTPLLRPMTALLSCRLWRSMAHAVHSVPSAHSAAQKPTSWMREGTSTATYPKKATAATWHMPWQPRVAPSSVGPSFRSSSRYLNSTGSTL
mmetsp:Transcript_55774/g.157103  ORF Transcript_55774/g.157103 Transcript_55774/m.157103 type:complete len:230 (+) Transcript_55774:253-942(+)